MGNFEDIFGNYFDAYKNTSQYKDSSMMEIVARKIDFEKNLDEMWKIYNSGVTKQIINYNKGIDEIKKTGLKVFRNSVGKHKIIIPK